MSQSPSAEYAVVKLKHFNILLFFNWWQNKRKQAYKFSKVRPVNWLKCRFVEKTPGVNC